jgi:hypothetical protein
MPPIVELKLGMANESTMPKSPRKCCVVRSGGRGTVTAGSGGLIFQGTLEGFEEDDASAEDKKFSR